MKAWGNRSMTQMFFVMFSGEKKGSIDCRLRQRTVLAGCVLLECSTGQNMGEKKPEDAKERDGGDGLGGDGTECHREGGA